MRTRWFLSRAALLIGVAAVASSQIVYERFDSPRLLRLVEEATLAGKALRVCPATTYARGAAWNGRQQRVADGFLTRFRFQYTEQHAKGGDGFAFVVQDHDRQAIGTLYGGALGYSHWPECGAGGIPASLAVEFDGWRNMEWNDPDDNHLSVHTNGTGPNCAHEDYSIGRTSAIPDLHTEDVHEVTIRYVPGTLTVYMDDPVTPVLTVSVDLAATLGLDDGAAFVGFTAGTGQEVQNHDVLSWIFLEPTSGPRPLFGLSF